MSHKSLFPQLKLEGRAEESGNVQRSDQVLPELLYGLKHFHGSVIVDLNCSTKMRRW
jgi:hypothetical protein